MVTRIIKVKKSLSNVDEVDILEQEQEIEEFFTDPITGE